VIRVMRGSAFPGLKVGSGDLGVPVAVFFGFWRFSADPLLTLGLGIGRITHTKLSGFVLPKTVWFSVTPNCLNPADFPLQPAAICSFS
jgi:hypothetical protein